MFHGNFLPVNAKLALMALEMTKPDVRCTVFTVVLQNSHPCLNILTITSH